MWDERRKVREKVRVGERRRLKEERERKREETSRDRQIELILLPSTRRRNNTNDDKREKERGKERFDIVKNAQRVVRAKNCGSKFRG